MVSIRASRALVKASSSVRPLSKKASDLEAQFKKLMSGEDQTIFEELL